MKANALISFSFLPGTKMKVQLIKIATLFLLLFCGFQSRAVDPPVITVRFANPEFVCTTNTYSLDVEFQSSIAGKQLYLINVRFYYPDNVLEFVSFGEYATGYAQLGSVQKSTGNANSGPGMFGFPGPSEYINGSVQKSGTPTAYLNPGTWTKLFNASFHVDDTNAFNIDSFCPSVIWDLKENPADGGFAPGSGGVTITVINGGGSAQATENVVQFNWQYDGIPGLPYGFPVSTNCINTICAYAPHTYLPVCGVDVPGLVILR